MTAFSPATCLMSDSRNASGPGGPRPISLTEAGRDRQRRVGGRHAVSVAREVIGRLTEAETRQLEAICRKLADLDPTGQTMTTDDTSARATT